MLKWFGRKISPGILILTVLISLGMAVVITKAPPLLDRIPFSRAYFSREGILLGIYPAGDDQYRMYSHLSEFPGDFLEILLLQEDQHFYSHPGINPRALMRAFYHTYIMKDRRIGGSTITMQLARMYFHMETHSIPGKIAQLIRALTLELRYSKKEILEAYINLAPCGGNIQGFATASWIFFNRPPEELNLDEIMLLCILPQNPLNRDPRYNRNINEARNARNLLYARWKERNPQKEEEIFHLSLLPEVIGRPEYKAPHLTEMLNERESVIGTVRTTINGKLQEVLDRKVKENVEKLKEKGVRNAAALILDTRSMEIRAMVGSAGFFDASIQGMVNGAASRRSPGSTLKPFIYALAMDYSLIHSNTILYDRPVNFSSYAPDNYQRDFKGPVSAWNALVNSRNIPAVELNALLKEHSLYELLNQAGLGDLKPKNYYGLSIVLGSAELTMLELAALYGTLANGGVMKDIRISDTEVLQHMPAGSLFSPQAAGIVRRILERNPPPGEGFPPFQNWSSPEGEPLVAYKTGTSIGFKDAWSIGLYGPYAVAVWVGNFSGEGNPAFLGRETAGPLLFSICRELKPLVEKSPPVVLPEGVKLVDVCSVSGAIPTEYCTGTEAALFIPGVSPITPCRVHRPVFLRKNTGLRTRRAEGDTVTVVREVWPSDLLVLFQQAGIPRPVPPEYEETSGTEGADSFTQPPRILSPVANAQYILRPQNDRYGRIPLIGSADGDTEELFWFAGGQFLGKSGPGEDLYWEPGPGEYDLILLDNRGLSADRHISVTMEP